MIRVAIAEDIEKIAESLKTKLELSDQIEVVNISCNGREMLQQVQKGLETDIILMDINMPDMDGITATEKVLAINPAIKIIMCTVFDDEDNIFEAIVAGASGYILKDESPSQFHKAITETAKGGGSMSPSVLSKTLKLVKEGKSAADSQEQFDLSERETEILLQLSKGVSYEQIAINLGISYGTVRKHIENTYRKLKVHNKVEAINKARQHKLF